MQAEPGCSELNPCKLLPWLFMNMRQLAMCVPMLTATQHKAVERLTPTRPPATHPMPTLLLYHFQTTTAQSGAPQAMVSSLPSPL
jgi:hypothetical protein